MDVCIIGAGWSGLYACKYAVENGLNPIVLEKRDDLGGVWNYSDDPEITTVMQSTVSSSSRLVTEASDFFMDQRVGEFMHHREIVGYLRAYIKNFDLARYLQFNAEVESMRKDNGKWVVTYRQRGETKTICVDKVAVCAGIHNKQRKIGEPICNFTGQVMHAGSIKKISPGDFQEGDNVIVYGGGETASDIIDLLVKTPAQITWAIRGGQHFLRKTPYHQRPAVGEFSKEDFALDTIASPLINGTSSFSRGAPGRRYITDWLSTGSVAKYQGHGIGIWRNEHRYAQQFFNKNGHAVEFVHSGRVRAENDVVEVSGDEVKFKSGNQRRYTHIICCFGYDFHCPFLPADSREGKLEDMYQFVFPPHDPSIAFLGFARPIIGSIPLITEMQCLWAFRVWSNKIELPSTETMVQRQAANQEKWARKLPGRGSLKTLVLPSTYVAMMLKEAYPDRRPADHFWRMPIRALKFLSWIPSGSIRFALDPEISNDDFNRLWRQRSHGWFLAYLLPMIILISRLMRIEKVVDWYVDRHESRRMETQLAKASRMEEPRTSSPLATDMRNAA